MKLQFFLLNQTQCFSDLNPESEHNHKMFNYTGATQTEKYLIDGIWYVQHECISVLYVIQFQLHVLQLCICGEVAWADAKDRIWEHLGMFCQKNVLISIN